ncbi:MAG TPA: hypothetical protein VFV99_32345 [Kofleriaceae bacterium]|nr:hypothetical protein [Kofleriaceae bacterium]
MSDRDEEQRRLIVVYGDPFACDSPGHRRLKAEETVRRALGTRQKQGRRLSVELEMPVWVVVLCFVMLVIGLVYGALR